MVILHNSFLYKYDFLWILAQISTKAGCCFLPQAYSTRPFVLGGIIPS